MATTPRLMTGDELAALPDDGMRHELVRGELTTMVPPGFEHGRIAGRLGARLGAHVLDERLGEIVSESGYVLEREPDTVRAPDVAFVSAGRDLTGATFPAAVPDLVAEVVSPGDRYGEVDEKTEAWLAAGARMVLVVNPRRRTVEVHRPGRPMRTLAEHDTLDGEDVVAGWRLELAELSS